MTAPQFGRRDFIRTAVVAPCFAALAAEAMGADVPAVLNGIDMLREQNFAPLAGKRLGLITNHTGMAYDATPTIDLLFQSKAGKLVALFSPEHGIRGLQDSKVSSGVDEKTGLPIHSLYGESQRPTGEMLQGVDALVFDILDIGARFYTYPTTMAYCMEEAARRKIAFFVLDRPNPIGGLLVEGPMLDPDKTSFTGYCPLPVRHGMTVGEMAKYFEREKGIGGDLRVVAMRGWHRRHYFEDTGQVWVNPSPNMRSMPAAVFYTGVCLLEPTNVSVGRGTERPFELFGAPWIEPRQLASHLSSAGLEGVEFVPLFFTPAASVHREVRCGGIALYLTSRDRFRPVLTGLTLLSALHKLYPDKFEIDRAIRLLGNQRALTSVKEGKAPARILQEDEPALKQFLGKRQKALIYDGAQSSTKGGQ